MLNDTFPRAVIFTFSFYTSLLFFEPLKLISPPEITDLTVHYIGRGSGSSKVEKGSNSLSLMTTVIF